VMVHVECGTQSLAGAVHNAANGRAPVLNLRGYASTGFRTSSISADSFGAT
jgi:hypothetical protein